MSQQQYRRRLRESGESLFPSLTRGAPQKPLDQPLLDQPPPTASSGRSLPTSISIDGATNGSRLVSLSTHTEEHDDDYIPSGVVRDKLMVFGGQRINTPERRYNGNSEMLPARKRSQETPTESHNASTPQSNESLASSTISSQTEVLFSPGGDSTLIDRGNYKANVQILIAELDAAKDLNKKLSMQLAKVERDYQSLSIQQDVQKEQTEATVASRVADAVKEIKAAAAANNHPWTTRSHRWANGDVVSESELLQSTNLVAPSVRAIESQTESNVEADNPEAILNSVSGGSLSPTAIAENCDRMMAYINQYGCQLPNDGQAAKVVRAATNTSTDDKNPVLTDKIVQIEAELQRLKSDLNEKDNKIIELSQSLAISESRSDELKKQNLDLNQKGNESEKKLAAVRSELEQITKRQSDTEQMTMGYRRKMEEMEQQLSARSDRIERLEAQLLEAEKNSKNASANGSSSSSASRGHEQFEELAHQQLKNALADRSSEIDRLRAKLVAADRDRATWEAQRKALEAKKPADVQTILSQKRELTMQLDREQNEKHELFLQINTYIAQLADSKKEAAEAQQHERHLKGELDRLKSVQANQAQLESDVTELQAEVRRKADEVERSRAQLAELNSNFDLEREKLTNEVNELSKELQLKSAALQTLRLVKGDPAAAKSDADEQSALQATVQKATARNNELEAQLSALQTQLQERQTLYDALSAQQNASVADLAGKDKAVDDLTSASEELRRKVAALEDENTKLQQHSSTITSLQASLKSEEEKNSALRESSSRLEDELKKAVAQLALVESDANKEGDRAETSETVLRDVRAQNASLESSVARLEKDLSEARAATATLQDQLSSASTVQATLADTNKDNAALKAEISRLEAEVAEVKAKSNNSEQQQKTIEAAVSSARVEAEASKEALVKTTVQLAAAEASVAQLKSEVRELNNRPSSEDVQSLSAQISAMGAENTELKARIAQLQKESEKSDLLEKFTALTAEKERLSEDLERVNMRHEQSESKWNHELYDLQQKFRDADESKHKLEDEVDDLKRQLKVASQAPPASEASPPQAPPRKVNDENGKGALEENQKLKAELEKQQRLVSVLRRKLQHAQTTG